MPSTASISSTSDSPHFSPYLLASFASYLSYWFEQYGPFLSHLSVFNACCLFTYALRTRTRSSPYAFHCAPRATHLHLRCILRHRRSATPFIPSPLTPPDLAALPPPAGLAHRLWGFTAHTSRSITPRTRTAPGLLPYLHLLPCPASRTCPPLYAFVHTSYLRPFSPAVRIPLLLAFTVSPDVAIVCTAWRSHLPAACVYTAPLPTILRTIPLFSLVHTYDITTTATLPRCHFFSYHRTDRDCISR